MPDDLDAQRLLWALSAFITAGVIGFFSAPIASLVSPSWLAAVLAILLVPLASWAALRGLVEIGLRWLWPGRISRHIPRFLAGAEGPKGPWFWQGTVGERIAWFEYRRLIEPVLPTVRDEIRGLLRAVKGGSTVLENSLRQKVERWKRDDFLGAPSDGPITFPDPIHSSITLGADFDTILRHPLLQRLNEIRQLAFAFPAYPGGSHTRLSHSLGVAHLAGYAVSRVLDRGRIYTPSGETTLRLRREQQRHIINLATACGLVHDVAHPALGHTLDKFFGAAFDEGDLIADKKLLPGLLGRLKGPLELIDGVRLQDVERVLLKSDRNPLPGWYQFISYLVASELDVDRLDYLQRDAHATGQQEGLLNIERIVGAIRPFKVKGSVNLAFDVGVLHHIEQFIYARDAMYLRCYEERSKVVSEHLVRRALNELVLTHPELNDQLEDFALLSDGQLIELIMESDSENARATFVAVFRSEASCYAEVDSALLLLTELQGSLATLRNEFDFSEGRLQEIVVESELEIANEAGVDPAHVVITLPDPRLADEKQPGEGIRLVEPVGAGYRMWPLFDEKTDDCRSEFLRRHKVVPIEKLRTADDMDQVREIEASAKGVSMLSLLREARNKVRLYLHKQSWHHKDEVVTAFRKLGVINKKS